MFHFTIPKEFKKIRKYYTNKYTISSQYIRKMEKKKTFYQSILSLKIIYQVSGDHKQ